MPRNQPREGELPGLPPALHRIFAVVFETLFFFFSSWRIGGLSVHDKRLGSLAQVEVTPFPPRSYLLIRTIGPYRGTAQYP